MRVFRLEKTFDAAGNSQWDAVWPEDDAEMLRFLRKRDDLRTGWNPLPVKMERRKNTPSVYGFVSDFAMTLSATEAIAPLLGDSADFLPLKVDDGTVLYAIHSRLHIPLSPDADVHQNGVSKNITVIRDYDFAPDDVASVAPMFRVSQASDSAAARVGSCCTPYLVTDAFVETCKAASLTGICFHEVYSLDS